MLALHPLADRGVKMLSGGAQQRTSIGRALVRDPELILFDEPLSHLDADQKIHLRTEIKRLQKLGAVTSILVTHDQTEATAMADRIAVMNQGVLQQVATPHELYERPANMFVANFIGEPPMNLLPLRCPRRPPRARRRRLAAAARRPPHQAGASGAAAGVTAGIRPEHVSVRRGACDGFRAIVRYCEPRGDVDVVVGGRRSSIAARRSSPRSRDRPAIGRTTCVGIEFAADHVYLFAAADGRNLEVPS